MHLKTGSLLGSPALAGGGSACAHYYIHVYTLVYACERTELRMHAAPASRTHAAESIVAVRTPSASASSLSPAVAEQRGTVSQGSLLAKAALDRAMSGGAPTMWLVAMLVLALQTVWVRAAVDVAIDLSDSSRIDFPHYFERCVGSGHGALTLREDWRQHVDMAHKDLGIQRVRFHGILDDDMSVSFSPNETGFVNIDSICDWLVQRNMSMVMELGFMPRWLARDRSGAVPVVSEGQQDTITDGNYSCTHSINHYIGCSDPPYDFNLWGALIYELGKHLVERYGVEELESKWMFEVVRKHAARPLPCGRR
jgi:hypothetical protein